MMQAQWRVGWTLSDEKREWFRQKSIKSAARKRTATYEHSESLSSRQPRFNPHDLMPLLPQCGITEISLFSGCGGLDIGFEQAGFKHELSADILDICGETLKANRPTWNILSGQEHGDVRKIDWKKQYVPSSSFTILHGGPPCQPFSNAGRQLGQNDSRNMVPEFFRAVREIEPDAFAMENVPALGSAKFKEYLDNQITRSLGDRYEVLKFFLFAPDFGVPQQRKRYFVVGFKNKKYFDRFSIPQPTHSLSHFYDTHRSLRAHIDRMSKHPGYSELPPTMGVRRAIGLDNSYPDGLSPTFRSGFTGPRNSTSILNGASSQHVFGAMGLWGNGIAVSREAADAFPPENGTQRLSVQDIALIQGFPQEWLISGPVYKVIGQIGNSVAPPVAYQLAKALRSALIS